MTNRPRRNATLKSTLLIILLSATLPIFVVGNILSMNTLWMTRNRTLAEMENTTSALHNIFESLLRTSIKTYLRSKVEAGKDIALELIADAGNTEDYSEVKRLLAERLLKIRVGDSGYFYGIDSGGWVVFHPDPNVEGVNLVNDSPVRQQLELKEGYLEYEWKNSYETFPKNKALFMTYIPELDWYITATSYRDEFTKMIDIDTMEQAFDSLRFGQNGYSFVADSSGRFVIHPRYSNDSDSELLQLNDAKTIIQGLFRAEDGFSTYYWKDSNNVFSKKKIVFSKYIKDFDWIVGTTMYTSEINSHLTRIFITNILLTLIIAFFMFFVVRRIIRSIEIPVSDIYRTLNEATLGNLKVRTEPSGPLEIHEVGEYLNLFIRNLEQKTESLQNTIAEKEQLIHEIQHRINNNLQTISSIISLQLNSTGDLESKQVLRELYRRVSVIGMVYDHMLLTDADFSEDKLSLSAFFEDYISFFINSDKIDKNRIIISNDTEDIWLDRDLTINCGLLLNELLTHSCSRIMKESGEYQISVSCSRTSRESILFRIEDNADSFSPSGWNGIRETLTYTFVTVLVSQLNCEIQLIETDDGPYGFQIIFTAQPPESRTFSL